MYYTALTCDDATQGQDKLCLRVGLIRRGRVSIGLQEAVECATSQLQKLIHFRLQRNKHAQILVKFGFSKALILPLHIAAALPCISEF